MSEKQCTHCDIADDCGITEPHDCPRDEHHYFASHAIGWVTGDTRDEAVERLLLKNTDPQWFRNCMKAGDFLTVFVCRVPLPDNAPYKIEWYVPQVEGITETENRVVMYLTKTKAVTKRDEHDTVVKLTRELEELRKDNEEAGS